jgi:predicted alpha/beta superfamily hydrolase
MDAPPTAPHRAPRAFAATLAAIASLAFAAAASAGSYTLQVTVPRSTPVADVVYVAGDFQGWNPNANPLVKQSSSVWKTTITYAGTGPTTIQFKFTRGAWTNVEKGYDGEEIANHSLTVTDGGTYALSVLTWADLGTITGDVRSFMYAPFLGGRKCWVYLPPGYDASSDRYPVLYMHDGQNLFDVRTSFGGEWHVDETCDQFIAAGQVAPVIVVGIENGPNRIAEYTPWPDANYAGSGAGDAYLTAIRDVLVPYVDANYRTRTGRASRWMCGSSLGGLISAYAGYAYDATWSRVAAMSPSYWWDNQHMITFAQAHGKPALPRFYQDIGTSEGASAVTDLRAMRDVALAQGFVLGTDFQHVEQAGGMHNEYYWAQRFPGMLTFLASQPLLEVGHDAARAALELTASPNPARTGGRVAFTLAAPARVRVELLDLAGRAVRTLADRACGAGMQSLAWDRGALATGVYWVRITAGRDRAARRVVVVD